MNAERLIAFTQALVRQRSLTGEEQPVIQLILDEMRALGFDQAQFTEHQTAPLRIRCPTRGDPKTSAPPFIIFSAFRPISRSTTISVVRIRSSSDKQSIRSWPEKGLASATCAGHCTRQF